MMSALFFDKASNQSVWVRVIAFIVVDIGLSLVKKPWDNLALHYLFFKAITEVTDILQ